VTERLPETDAKKLKFILNHLRLQKQYEEKLKRLYY
jgi:hypothetical protein